MNAEFETLLARGVVQEEGKLALRIPNEEVKSMFGSTVKKWLEERMTMQDRTGLLEA